MAVAYTILRPAAHASISQIGFGTPRNIYNEIVTSAAFVLNESVQMVVIPPQFRLTGAGISFTDMDGGTAAVFDVGDATTSGLIFSGLTTAQAGGHTAAIVATAFGLRFTVATPIFLKCTTAPGTPVAIGTVKLNITGEFDTWA